MDSGLEMSILALVYTDYKVRGQSSTEIFNLSNIKLKVSRVMVLVMHNGNFCFVMLFSYTIDYRNFSLKVCHTLFQTVYVYN